jgi:hypothetical protein
LALKKLFWIAFVFIFIFLSHIFTNFTIFFETPRYEDAIMMDDYKRTIVGIDFDKGEFIYPRLREKKVMPFFSIIKEDFYYILRIKIFYIEIPVIWRDYNGAFSFFPIIYIYNKIFSFLGELWRWYILKKVIYHFFFSFLFLYFSFKLLERYFFIDRFIVFCLIFCALTTPTFYLLSREHHYAAASVFILGMLYFLMEKRYILAGIFGGFAIYTYLPTTYAILGLTLASFFYHRNLKGVVLIAFFSLIFFAPTLYYIFSSLNEKFYQIYNCSNCIISLPSIDLIKSFLGTETNSFFDLFKILGYLLISLIFLPFRFSEILVPVFTNLREAFSLLELMLRYGYLEQLMDFKFKNLAYIGIIVNISAVLLGIFYIRKRFEVVAYIFSLIFYVLLSRYLMLMPRMIYFLLPVYFLISVRVINEFTIRRRKILVLIFFISCFLRLTEFVDMSGKIRPAMRWKENKEVVDFFKDKGVKSEDILLYCRPPDFKIFSNGKLDPTFFLPALASLDPHLRKKTIEFIVNKSNFRYLVFDMAFAHFISEILQESKEDMEIVFKNKAFMIVEIRRNSRK